MQEFRRDDALFPFICSIMILECVLVLQKTACCTWEICSAWRRADGGETLLLIVFSFITRGSRRADTDLLSLVTSGRTWGHGLKLCQGRFRLNSRKRFFSQRVFGSWNCLPRGVVTAAAWQSSRRAWTMLSGTRWDSLSGPVQGQELDSVIPVGPFQVRTFYDSVSMSPLKKIIVESWYSIIPM